MDKNNKKNYCRELKQLSANIKYEILVEKDCLLFVPIGSQFDTNNISGSGSANLALTDDKTIWTKEYQFNNLKGSFFIALILAVVGTSRNTSKIVFSGEYFLGYIILPLFVITCFLSVLRMGIQYMHIIRSANKKPHQKIIYDKSIIQSITFNKYDLGAKPNIGEIAIGSIYIKFYDGSKKKFYGNRGIDMHLLLDTLVKFGYINTTISTKKSFLFRALRG